MARFPRVVVAGALFWSSPPHREGISGEGRILSAQSNVGPMRAGLAADPGLDFQSHHDSPSEEPRTIEKQVRATAKTPAGAPAPETRKPRIIAAKK
jgi:hypothetical protein